MYKLFLNYRHPHACTIDPQPDTTPTSHHLHIPPNRQHRHVFHVSTPTFSKQAPCTTVNTSRTPGIMSLVDTSIVWSPPSCNTFHQPSKGQRCGNKRFAGSSWFGALLVSALDLKIDEPPSSCDPWRGKSCVAHAA